jgi:hypothetical protein
MCLLCGHLFILKREKEKNKCPKGILSSGRSFHTNAGDGGWNLMGSHFWVGCGFFSSGDGGVRERVRGSTVESFSRDDTRFQIALFFMLYIIY